MRLASGELVSGLEMAYTDDDYLPSPAELDVPQEIDLTSAPLRGVAHQMGKWCDNESKEFMLCRSEEGDPRYCIKEGKAVTACGVQFLQLLKKHCYQPFTTYWQCVDYEGRGRFRTATCRAQQLEYDNCVKEYLGQERVHYGYFGKIRLHETKRPKPTELPIKHAPFPDEEPKEWNCEDIQAVKGHYEGELWSNKFKPLIDDAVKVVPAEQRPMWYNDPAMKQKQCYVKHAELPQDAKPKRYWASDFGL